MSRSYSSDTANSVNLAEINWGFGLDLQESWLSEFPTPVPLSGVQTPDQLKNSCSTRKYGFKVYFLSAAVATCMRTDSRSLRLVPHPDVALDALLFIAKLVYLDGSAESLRNQS